MQRYKVFFNDRTIFFTSKPDNDLIVAADAIFKFDTLNGLKKITKDFLSKENLKNVVVYGFDPEQIFTDFTSLFKNIEAAGGVVFNSKNEFIGIFRRGRNDLPKGKLENGESAEEGAVREVMEECGIHSVKVSDKITVTRHIYHIGDTPVLKNTHWFRMYTDDTELIPQTEEDISDIFYVAPDDIKKFAANTYSSILDVLIEAGLSDR